MTNIKGSYSRKYPVMDVGRKIKDIVDLKKVAC